MFWPAPFNLTAFIQGCQQQFNGLTPRPYWVGTQYGGWDLEGLSNVVFANGNLDPWYSGGITHNVSGTTDVIAVVIAEGAHHLDLRATNDLDPASVIEARLIETAAMTRWINQHYERKGIDRRV
jgi:lysosomal Pro-X carboxypeptidase